MRKHTATKAMKVRPKLYYRGLTKVTRPWTGVEDATLRLMILAGEPAGAVAGALDRTIPSIQHRAYILELSITRNLNLRATRNQKYSEKQRLFRENFIGLVGGHRFSIGNSTEAGASAAATKLNDPVKAYPDLGVSSGMDGQKA